MRKRRQVQKIIRDAAKQLDELERKGWTRADFEKALSFSPLVEHRDGETLTEYLNRCAAGRPIKG